MLTNLIKSPWQRFAAPLQAMTVAEALKGARLDFDVLRAPLEFMAADGARYSVDKQFVNYRQEDGRVKLLGVVSDQYEIVQNSAAFSILDAALAGQNAVFTAGGEARGRFFLQVHLPGQALQVNSNGVLEDIERYLLVSTSHDGSTALTIAENPIRVRCWNTLVLASTEGTVHSVRHTGDANQRVQELRSAIATGYTNLRDAVTVMNQMAAVAITEDDFVNFITAIYPLIHDRNDTAKVRNIGKVAFEQMADAYLYGKGNNGKTLWDAYNAVTEYVDFRRQVAPTRWIEYTVFGAGAEMKASAFSLAAGAATTGVNVSDFLAEEAQISVDRLIKSRG